MESKNMGTQILLELVAQEWKSQGVIRDLSREKVEGHLIG